MPPNTSKQLSWLLRHGANQAGLVMDAAGWAQIADVLAISRLSRTELDSAVRENNKARLEVDATGERIRAAQGHSLAGTPVTREALEASWHRFAGVASVWHGTRVAAISGIAQLGILPGERTHVHLAAAVDSTVGKRAAVDLLLEISAPRLRAQGLELYQSSNGVILARSVPSSCIIGLEVVTQAARRQAADLRVSLGLGIGEGPGTDRP